MIKNNKTCVKRKLYGKEKYKNVFFVEKYVALWAFGYQNGIGYSEGLYRSINELGFSYLKKDKEYEILDIGCGVGRTSADYAKFFKNARITGIDSSSLMIGMANKINKTNEEFFLDMSNIGFGKMKIKSERINNINFYNTELESFYNNKKKGVFNLVIAVNFFDRVSDVEKSIKNIFNLLTDGGVLILSTPLNFINGNNWDKYGSLMLFKNLVEKVGFSVDIALDNFIYQEMLDARGSIEQYKTIVLRLKK